MIRFIEKNIIKDLSKKMVFLGGPRQVGKTTLARSILKKFPYKRSKERLYLNLGAKANPYPHSREFKTADPPFLDQRHLLIRLLVN